MCFDDDEDYEDEDEDEDVCVVCVVFCSFLAAQISLFCLCVRRKEKSSIFNIFVCRVMSSFTSQKTTLKRR